MPATTPVTTPPEEVTVAIDVLLLLHTPPLVASVNVVVSPGHTGLAPPPIIPGGRLVMVSTHPL